MDHWPVFPKKVLSPVEQQLSHRLLRAFPDHVVLAQVAFSQLVGVKKGENFTAIWNRYNRLTADFVVCNKDFSIAAVLELDDRSHDHPRARTPTAAKPRSAKLPASRCTDSTSTRCRTNSASRTSAASRLPHSAASAQSSTCATGQDDTYRPALSCGCAAGSLRRHRAAAETPRRIDRAQPSSGCTNHCNHMRGVELSSSASFSDRARQSFQGGRSHART